MEKRSADQFHSGIGPARNGAFPRCIREGGNRDADERTAGRIPWIGFISGIRLAGSPVFFALVSEVADNQRAGELLIHLN